MSKRSKETDKQGLGWEGLDAQFDELDAPESESVTGAGKPGASEAELARTREHYAAILEVSASMNSILNLQDLLESIVDGIVRVTGCERGFLMLVEEDDELSVAIARSRDGREWQEEQLEISRTVVRRVAASGEPLIISNVSEEADLRETRSIHAFNIMTAVCLPLQFEGRLTGVIYADSKFMSEKFVDADVTLLRAFAAQAAVAIENARRHGELASLQQSLERENQTLRQKLGEEFAFYGMISKAKSMEEVFAEADKIAAHDVNVLIQGESGTGKELLANAIHQKSSRSHQRFEVVNCAAIPEGLVEGTLFGHRKGAFTGAAKDHAGVFEVADGGTLFLDEIGDMPIGAQAKILRAAQDGWIKRLGEDTARQVNVRIIAATHVDLRNAVKQGTFREDLYFRLRVAELTLPPLRERREDILPLAEWFLKKYADEKEQPLGRLTRNAKEFLLQSDWPGNVRELRSAVERASIFQDDDRWIHKEQLVKFFGKEGVVDDTDAPLKEKMAKIEADIIRKTLVKNDYNVTTTAKALDISRQQLHNKLKKFGISTKE